jgi:hypothetical protein
MTKFVCQLREILLSEVNGASKEIDIRLWMGRLALELIAQAGLGHTFHSLEGENDEYSNALKSIVYVPFY